MSIKKIEGRFDCDKNRKMFKEEQISNLLILKKMVFEEKEILSLTKFRKEPD